MLKLLFLLMLPILIFGQNVDYRDSVVTKSSKLYVGEVISLGDEAVKIDLGDGVKANIELINISSIVLSDGGKVYDSSRGYYMDLHDYQKALSLRKKKNKTEETKSIERKKNYRPGDHEVLMMPTAYTMEKGQSYITDYELFFLNYTYAVTSSTHISAMVMFPIMTEFYKSFSIGVKQNYLNMKKFAGAVFGSYTLESNTFIFGNTFSVGNSYSAFHLGIGGATSNDIDHVEPIYMLGGTINVSDMVSILIEYDNSKEWFDNDFNGLFTFGFRFRSKRIAWEIAAIRPLAEDSGDLLFLPWLKATLMFGGGENRY